MSMLVNPFAFGAGGTGPGGAYEHHRALTIDKTKVPNTDQINFPVLISGTYSYLATVANGGDVENASGFDIIFTSDSAGLVQLDHEIESYDATTGAVNFWVRVPTVETAVDTVIYIHYGNASISTSQEDVNGVWDSDFALVAHMPDGSSLDASDSTSNNHTPTITNATAGAGQIDGAASFDGTNDHITYPDSVPLSPTGAITVSFWFQRAGGIGSNQVLLNKGNGTSNAGSSYEFVFNTSNQLRWEISNTAWRTAQYSTAISDTTTQHHAVGTFDGSDVKIYVDGVLRTTTAHTGSINDVTAQLWLGELTTGLQDYNGTLDEVRVSGGIARSADWIATEFNNQSSPATFYSVGSEI